MSAQQYNCNNSCHHYNRDHDRNNRESFFRCFYLHRHHICRILCRCYCQRKFFLHARTFSGFIFIRNHNFTLFRLIHLLICCYDSVNRTCCPRLYISYKYFFSCQTFPFKFGFYIVKLDSSGIVKTAGNICFFSNSNGFRCHFNVTQFKSGCLLYRDCQTGSTFKLCGIAVLIFHGHRNTVWFLHKICSCIQINGNIFCPSCRDSIQINRAGTGCRQKCRRLCCCVCSGSRCLKIKQHIGNRCRGRCILQMNDQFKVASRIDIARICIKPCHDHSRY